MPEEQRQWRFLGNRYKDFENLRLAGSFFRDQQGVFGWRLDWFDIQQSRTLNEQYWFDKGHFFEVVWLDNDSHWKPGKKLTPNGVCKETCMREAMIVWENEERDYL